MQSACHALASAGVVLAASSANVAQAQNKDCADLPNPIYGIGGSAATNLIKKVGIALAGLADPITVIYDDPGACYAMTALVSGTNMTGTPKYWTKDGKELKCNLPAIDGHPAEWGSMAQQATTCQGVDALPNTVGDEIGPISGFSIIVPKTSTQQNISAEALYLIYGFGADQAQVSPWTNPNTLGSRTTTSAAGLLLAKAVGIPLSRTLAGTDTGSQSKMITFVTSGAAASDPESALGFVSTEAADAVRDKVRSLAFQAQGQTCAYYPDATASAFDKINIREGRYFLWNPHHFFAKLDGPNGNVENPHVRDFIDYVTQKKEIPGASYLDLLIDNGNIPQCAMHVTRDDDMGPLQSFQPDEPCGCYFDARATGNSDCDTCKTDDDCPSSAPKCRLGYCEEK